MIFLAMLAGLGLVAALSLLTPKRTITGLPDDPDARSAAALVRERFRMGAGALRFRSSLTGEAWPGWPFSVADAAAAAQAEAMLERARARRPLDPRLVASLAHLDVGRRRLTRAEDRYRRALVLVPHYGEARLGLGVALALRAENDADPLEQRSLRLQALAQFAAVLPADPEYPDALHDRALLAALVGREPEAERWAREYLLHDSTSTWAESLAARVGIPRR